MNRKLATVLLASGTVLGFGSGILSLGCGGHRRHHDKGAGYAAADCERGHAKDKKRGPAATPAPEAPAPAPEAAPQEGSL